jgi:hypothetical protein
MPPRDHRTHRDSRRSPRPPFVDLVVDLAARAPFVDLVADLAALVTSLVERNRKRRT